MNKKQYNNVIDYTLKHETTDDSLSTARAIFKNMGVALPNGDMKEVYETLKTDNYMGWKSCTMQEAQAAADKGTAAIGISENRIVVLSAADDEEPIAETASVMTLSESTSAFAVSDLQYYSYSNAKTGNGGGTSQGTIYFKETNINVKVGWSGYNAISGSTTSTICWTSSDPDVASVGYYSGYITTYKAGIAVITASTCGNNCQSTSFEIWVKGKTPVFLIHGRTSNSTGVWGINNNISDGKNDHFDSNLNAKSSNGMRYTERISQSIKSFEPNKGDNDTDYPCNLGNELIDAGYKENVNLFVFNYPNQDAVVHDAKKFEEYIKNLTSYVRTSGTDEMKACFYNSRSDYNFNYFKINLVGHSMGGLVSRYYVENLGHDENVDKLITICTPHWGSGYADVSCGTGEIAELGMHKLCDHDLRFNSKMYGGSFSTEFDCNAMFELNQCYTRDYLLTDELLYDKTRNTKYYAIAGVDYPIAIPNDNDFTFEMPTNFTTTQQIVDYFTEMGMFSFSSTSMSIIEISPKDVGDNMVGLLSQIGWIGDNPDINTPEPRIQMEKIFIDVDTNGGNGNGIPGFEVLNLLHNKIPHRDDVIKQILYYLYE